jgi:hypothetical protein
LVQDLPQVISFEVTFDITQFELKNPETTTLCAEVENDFCTFEGTKTVRYVSTEDPSMFYEGEYTVEV